MLLKSYDFMQGVQSGYYLTELVPPFLYAGHTSLLHELRANAVSKAKASITTNFFILYPIIFIQK
jgi:hypothetical protein